MWGSRATPCLWIWVPRAAVRLGAMFPPMQVVTMHVAVLHAQAEVLIQGSINVLVREIPLLRFANRALRATAQLHEDCMRLQLPQVQLQYTKLPDPKQHMCTLLLHLMCIWCPDEKGDSL